MYWVYVLKSLKDNGWYIGQTSNLDNRLKLHKDGKVRSTRSRRPFRLIYKESHISRASSQRAEKYYKSGAGRVKLKIILNK